MAGLDFGEVEDVVDEGQEALAADADDLGEFFLFAGERGVHEQGRHADDAVHGGADLVAHGREELALGDVGLFGGDGGLAGDLGGLGESGVELFGGVAGVLEFGDVGEDAEPDLGAVLAGGDGGAGVDPAFGAVGTHDRVGVGPRLGGGDGVFEMAEDAFAVIGVDGFVEAGGRGEDLVAGASEERAKAGAQKGEGALVVGGGLELKEHTGGMGGERDEALFVGFEFLCGGLAFADVAFDGHETGEGAGRVVERLDLDVGPEGGAGLGVVDDFDVEAFAGLDAEAHDFDGGEIGERALEA